MLLRDDYDIFISAYKLVERQTAGVYPWLLYSLLPFPVEYEPYTAAHVLTQSQLLFFSALAFVWLKLNGLYPPELPGVNIDAEWSYRKALPALIRGSAGLLAALRDNTLRGLKHLLERLINQIYKTHGPDGVLARTWPTGSMAFWTTFILGAYLLASFL